MSTLDPRTPVLVGAGQTAVDGADASAGPVSMPGLMAEAARAAIADTGIGADQFREPIGLVGVADCLTWRPSDPGRALGAMLGVDPAETVATYTSGTSPLDLLADACQRIQHGAVDTALLAGGEAVRALQRGTLDNGDLDEDGPAPTRMLGTDRHPHHPAEEAADIRAPIQFYPLFENALRASSSRNIDDHLAWIARLWARFAEVAKTNPHAWNTAAPSAEVIASDAGGNRMVAFPYRKLTTANISVNQAAAVLLCSAGAAERAGIPRENWVFVHGTAAGNDHWFVGQRHELHRSPAINAIGRALLGHAGIGVAEIAYRDLYSCFPSAVQITAAELGIDLDDPHRPPTVTGGLTFAGGPGSNYVMHSLATLLHRLREDPAATGLATATGWYLTKHAATLLSATAPSNGYRHQDVQDTVDALPAREIAEDYEGTGTVESYTVTYDRSGEPATGHLSCLLDDGRRALGKTEDPATIAQLLERDPVGATVELPSCTFAASTVSGSRS
ncbi:hypothetical protein [Haloechinothrix sp. LS1_15]|uniref:hypothetical protein n=1 Tax=Haloechinothrix sp. LS1_15 TaxID=2652248 RepID=UPI0029457E04|nr:hypothetical protein [Haloechinothrix sp. LS1_15]MDV6012528.1 acetyl-CoA acetyltransferase [Haloechinothrix sp. LS1_15]